VEQYKIITEKLHAAKIFPEEAGLRMLPTQEVELEPDKAVQVMKTIEALEELDDIVNVFSNLKMTEEVMAALEAE
jgi:transcriptional/translational regulatory protein YebC/TACO1